ncbi:MAG: TonB-dependent receptor, partial [Chitinophagales bacterium]
EVANHIIAILANEVAFYNPQTSADMLAQSGQIFVQKSQFGGGSPMIRGFATNRLLMVVDGVRMNTAILRSGNIQNVISIDPNNLEGTEIILGPGSVIYGSDALGGVMDFHTLKPKLAAADSLSFSGNALARFASANFEKTGHVDFNIGLKKWAFVTALSYNDFDNLRMGSKGPDEYLRPEYVEVINGVDSIIPNANDLIQVPTDLQYLGVMQKVRFRPNPDWDIEVGLHYSETSDYDRYDRLIEYRNGVPRSAIWYYGPQIWNMDVMRFQHTAPTSVYDAARLTFAYQFFEESRNDRSYQGGTFRSRTEQVDAYSLNLDLNKSIGITALYYGLEATYNGITSIGTDTQVATGITSPGPSRYPDGSDWQNYAAYGSAKWKLRENLTLQTGLRYSQVLTNATFDTTFYPFPFTDVHLNNGALSGSVGMAWLPGTHLQVNLNLSTGFRAPNIDDIGKVFDSEPGNVTVPNPDLKPEYAYNAELGVIKNFDQFADIQIAGYYTYLNS